MTDKQMRIQTFAMANRIHIRKKEEKKLNRITFLL